MLVQTARVILRKHSHFIDVGIRHIAERKVNTPVAARYRHRTDRALLGQLPDPVIITTC